MITSDFCTTPGWLERTLAGLRFDGCAIVEGVIAPDLRREVHRAMYEVRDRILHDVGEERLEMAGELGILRLMLAYDDVFFRLLEAPAVLEVVDATVSPTAILHLQNGLLLPPIRPDERRGTFQRSFHRDFPRVLSGYLMSINTFLAIDAFTPENGATLVVPGTHQIEERPSQDYLEEQAVAVECAPGSMIVFDSTLWHAAGKNVSGRDRLAVNQQFTRSYLKQQIDYVRALGDDTVVAQQPRTQQLLGWYTRVVSGLDEYYRPPEARLYRSGQG